MNEKQCKELRKAIVEKFPNLKNYKKYGSDEEKQLYSKFKQIYQKAKIQFKNTPKDKKQIIVIN